MNKSKNERMVRLIEWKDGEEDDKKPGQMEME